MRRHALAVSLLFLLGASSFGCGNKTPDGEPSPTPGPTPGETSFESDLPGGAVRGGDNASAEGGSPTSGPASAPAPAAPGAQNAGRPGLADADGNGASRAIVEADVIQVAGNTLYALSRSAGLAIVDISNPAALKLLGRYRELSGTPFEMYLRGDVAVLMFQGWAQYIPLDEGGYTYQSMSKIVALDVRNPSSVSAIGSFDVPGTINDSRIVGNVLYVVGYEDGYCYRCDQEKPTTAVSSLDVGDPRAIRKVDELRYSDKTGEYSWQRSITVTEDRMYVAGPEYGQNGPVGSTIQVIDISDPAGDLVEGATVQARGEISSRWQMDEHEGVLRVVSQSPRWRTTDPPVLQTFRVISSQELEPLARLNLVIPKQETLRSARFDGDRGYVITALQQDPLFTLDLSDPTAPKQVGELEMPGWIYHMEPRGERVLGLGYDQGNVEGSITVSLFDVSNLAAPKMLSRVNFGGSWGSLPEDQDRIHKVFRVLEDAGLILVPFSGYERSGDFGYCGKNIGGVQLVGYANDTLEGLGSAQTVGYARRALIHGEALLSVSDERVESFDIADRKAPKASSELILANTVAYAARLDGDVVVRVTTPNWDNRWFVETVDAANAEDVNNRLGQLDLSTVFESSAEQCGQWWYVQSYHSVGSRVYLLYEGHRELSRAKVSERESGVLVVDVADPTEPKVIGRTQWTSSEQSGQSAWNTYYGGYSYGGFGQTQPYLWSGDVLAFLEQRYAWNGTDTRSTRLRVVDLRDAENPRSTTLALLDNQEYSGLIADGDRVLTSHYAAPIGANVAPRTKFYVDGFDIADPSNPKALAPVNVPGALVHYDAASGRAVTSELRRTAATTVTAKACYERFANAEWEYPPNLWMVTNPEPAGRCVGLVQSLHLVELGETRATLEDTLTLSEKERIGGWSAGDGRVFATIGRGGYYYGGGPLIGDCGGPGCGRYIGPTAPEPVNLLVLGGFDSGAFETGRLTVEDEAASNNWWGFWGTPPIYADGQKALLLSQGDAAVVDASDLTNVHIVKTETLYGSVSSVEIRDGVALVALQQLGLQWIEL